MISQLSALSTIDDNLFSQLISQHNEWRGWKSTLTEVFYWCCATVECYCNKNWAFCEILEQHHEPSVNYWTEINLVQWTKPYGGRRFWFVTGCETARLLCLYLHCPFLCTDAPSDCQLLCFEHPVWVLNRVLLSDVRYFIEWVRVSVAILHRWLYRLKGDRWSEPQWQHYGNASNTDNSRGCTPTRLIW